MQAKARKLARCEVASTAPPFNEGAPEAEPCRSLRVDAGRPDCIFALSRRAVGALVNAHRRASGQRHSDASLSKGTAPPFKEETPGKAMQATLAQRDPAI